MVAITLLLILGIAFMTLIGVTSYRAGRAKGISEATSTFGFVLGGIVEAIDEANTTREHTNLHRRIMKLGEEFGEACQAYLHTTSASNAKKMTWGDVREELADAVIVSVDCALTPTPDQVEAGMSRADVARELARVVGVKLAKWRRNRDTGKAATDAE